MSLLIRNARVFPGAGAPTLPLGDVLIEGDRIVSVHPASPPSQISPAPEKSATYLREIEAAGRVLLPGFVDAHTHALWAGDRLDEWEMKRRGATYLDILKAGGGILSTVRAVRAASEAELTENLSRRLAVMLREGATTIEVKSGYGLTTAAELKMLRAIAAAARAFPGTIVPTALLGHALDPGQKNFVDTVVEETLPAVNRAFPGITIDAYCEEGAWSLADCRKLFLRAQALGHPLRLHADQFNRLGALDLAIALGARSVDHLEASSIADLQRLAGSSVFGVMLPGAGFHTDDRYANARAFLEAGGRLVLATNCNPGSAPTSSLPFIIALAARKLGLQTSEALLATTTTAADLLNLPDRGRIASGLRADLILLRHRDERLLGYEFGGNPVDLVICAGRVVFAQ